MAQAHPFYYSAPRRDYKRDVNFAVTRDAEANAQLRIALQERGYGSGESVLNFPGRQCRFDLLPEDRLTRVDTSFAKSADVFVKTTRPPLSDAHHGDNKKIEPSNSFLERVIFCQYWRYFRTVCRSYIELAPETARFLPEDKQDRAMMTFYQTKASYQYLQGLGEARRSRRDPLGNVTAAFLFVVSEIWRGGPGLVAAWGVDAISTVAFCNLLRYRCPELLDNRGLTMVELEPTPGPERPTTYEWTRDWKYDLVFQTNGELPDPDEFERGPVLV